jgi:hypothetical protein
MLCAVHAVQRDPRSADAQKVACLVEKHPDQRMAEQFTEPAAKA